MLLDCFLVSIQSPFPSLHLQAAKSKQPIDVSVTLMDGRTVGLHLESASTSAEICQAMAESTGLKDTYGFSLYISLYEKVQIIPNFQILSV